MQYNSQKIESISYLMLIIQRFITSSKILKVIASNLLIFLSKTSLLSKRLRLLSEHIKNSEIFRQSNTKNLLNGGENGEIVISHTYYFTKDFFDNLEFTKVHLSTYIHQKSRFALGANDLDGDFLRYVGKKN